MLRRPARKGRAGATPRAIERGACCGRGDQAAGGRGKWAEPIQHNRALSGSAALAGDLLRAARPRSSRRAVHATVGYVWRPGRLHVCSVLAHPARAKRVGAATRKRVAAKANAPRPPGSRATLCALAPVRPRKRGRPFSS